MESANNFVGVILGLLSVGATLIGAVVYFHGVAMETIREVQTDLKEVQKGLTRIEKDMLRTSDERVENLLASFAGRVDELEEQGRRRHRDVKRELGRVKDDLSRLSDPAELPPLVTDGGKVIHLGSSEGAGIEGQLAYVMKKTDEHEKAISTFRRVITAHQQWLKELRGKKNDGS